MRLFSYCIPIDDGAAPNPFWEICSLTICKPVIRRVAEEGDWIVGLGSKSVNGVNYSGKIVYAMKVTRKMSLQKYDKYCKQMLPGKLPDIEHTDYKRNVGDCIYDFDKDWQGALRASVHSLDNIQRDLAGLNALLSNHFYYFGNKAVDLPEKFKIMIRQGQGHQSIKNEPIKIDFIKWMETSFEKNKLYGEPQFKVQFSNANNHKSVCAIRVKASEEDESLSYPEEDMPLSHWHYYLLLEADLKRISRYIEIHETNFNTFSIGLTQLLMATCSEIDVIFKEICKITSVKKARDIINYFEISAETIPLLFQKKVAIPLYKIELFPFKDWKHRQPPKWWTSYNKVKHHRNTNYSDANLGNCINALGALYILIFELIRVFKGENDTELSSRFIYKYLQPRQELFMLESEEMWRDIAEGKNSILGR